jgi:hypothetical protein
MTRWIATGLGGLALIFFSLDRANVEARLVSIERETLPARERLVRVETRLDYITQLLEEIRAKLDDDGGHDRRPAP